MTVPGAAAGIRAGIRDGWTTEDLLRIVCECINNSAWLETPVDRAIFFARPSTTGDPRWDALLAGVVEHLSREAGREPPAWVLGVRALAAEWYVVSISGMFDWTVENTPEPLARRKVLVDSYSLEAV